MQADKGVRLPRHGLLRGTVGSQAYGLATAESDVDELGVFALDTRVFHQIELPPQRILSVVTANPDVTLHEAGKFCRLALACNPAALELLWLPTYSHQTTAGRELVARRAAFLSAPRIIEVYTNYVHSQLRRIELLVGRETSVSGQVPTNFDRVAKLARHLLRLVEQATTLWVTGELVLQVRSGPDTHQFGAIVASGNVSMVYPLLARLRQTFESCTPRVPAEADRAVIQQWLYAVRDTYYEGP